MEVQVEVRLLFVRQLIKRAGALVKRVLSLVWQGLLFIRVSSVLGTVRKMGPTWLTLPLVER